jgi:hypothetical protein
MVAHGTPRRALAHRLADAHGKPVVPMFNPMLLDEQLPVNGCMRASACGKTRNAICTGLSTPTGNL